jgi:O-antigen chain-terminating methyltransferase
MFEIRDEEIDVQAIMAKIRENLERRSPDGGILSEQTATNLLPQGSFPPPLSLAGHRLNLIRILQDPKPQGPIASHGSLVIARIKRFMRTILAPYHRAIFARQAEFNSNVVGLMTELLQTLQRTRSEYASTIETLQSRLEILQADQNTQARQASTQAQELAGLNARLEILQADQNTQARQASTQAQELAGLNARLEILRTEQEITIGQLEKLTGSLDGKHGDLLVRLEELRQEATLQKRRLELILSELRQKIGDEGESLQRVASMKDRLMDHSYFLFENKYRLSREEIRKRQEIYVPLFKERLASGEHESGIVPSVILDVGCGRGEFIELLRENRIPAKGIDLNEDMVYSCKERGLDVEQANALDYLRSQPDDSLGGVFACQVIEHLPVDEMIELIKLCYQKMEKGGRAVFETVNPLSLVVSATNFYMDFSHVRQVHPAALQFLSKAVGFISTEIKFLSPYPDDSMLRIPESDDATSQQINENFKQLNDILFGYQDYALICEK